MPAPRRRTRRATRLEANIGPPNSLWPTGPTRPIQMLCERRTGRSSASAETRGQGQWEGARSANSACEGITWSRELGVGDDQPVDASIATGLDDSERLGGR